MNRLRRRVEVLRKEPRANPRDPALRFGVGGLDRQVAFHVETHRAPVEIGRADAEEAVVHDDQLRVHEDFTGAVRAGDDRVTGAEAAEPVRLHQTAEDAVAVAAHHPGFEVPVRRMRDQDDDFRPVGPRQLFREDLADAPVGEILRFDVDRPLRGFERVEGERLDLAIAACLAPARRGAGCGDESIGEVRREPYRPDAAQGRIARMTFAGRDPPARIGDVGDGARDVPFDGHLQIVHRLVGLSGRVDAAWIVRVVLARVPAFHRQVHAADEGEQIVDGDDLLVLGAVDRVIIVELHLDAGVVLPWRAEEHRHRRAGRMQGRKIPDQDADFEVRPLFHQRAEQVGERGEALLRPVDAAAGCWRRNPSR